jgi:hypothetical protein
MGTVLRCGLVLLVGLGSACEEGGGETPGDELVRCFRGSPDFTCYGINDRCSPDSPGFVDGPPPILRLSADPFLSFRETPAEDLDHDLLRDAAELEIATAIAPYAVNAWAVRRFWDEARLGGPLGLFQVRPLVDGEADVLQPDRRALLVRFVLLWDRDDGYQTGDACGLGTGYTSHDGDNQTYEYVLELAGTGTADVDPRRWRVRDPDRRTAWWYHPGAAPAAREVRELHPVIFFSRGKHHTAQTTCSGCAIAHCTEELLCPTAGDFHEVDAVSRLVDYWHRYVGRYLVAVDGSAGMARDDGWFGYPGPGNLLGNNVGEPDAHLLDALDSLCVFANATWPEDPGAPWEPHCFVDERAWDDREFWGGHCPGCDDFVRERADWHDTTAMGELWADGDLTDADADGLPNDADPCPVQAEGLAGPWPVAVDRDRDGLADLCETHAVDPAVQVALSPLP